MSNVTKFVVYRVIFVILMLALIVEYYRVVRKYTLTDSLYSVFLGWSTDTRWAEAYTESNFSKVRIGMTQVEVCSIMGEPIWQPNTNYWGYTKSPTGTHYHQRGFVFSQLGRVTMKVNGFYFD